MEIDINKIAILAKEREDENWDFRTFLKGQDDEEIDSIVYGIYQDVSSKIDCTACGNCCKIIQPILDKDDITKLSKFLKTDVTKFKEDYVTKDEDGENVLNQVPCPFLYNNKCTHYDSRPKDCKSYPHLHKKEFVFRLFGVIDNYSICPIVFNVYEFLKNNLHDNFKDFVEDMEEYDY